MEEAFEAHANFTSFVEEKDETWLKYSPVPGGPASVVTGGRYNERY